MRHKENIIVLLDALENELKRLQVWEFEVPSVEALQSQQPFAIDFLAFHQWLQWVFLPRMRYLLEEDQALPSDCGLFPMVSDWGRGQFKPIVQLGKILLALDDALSTQCQY